MIKLVDIIKEIIDEGQINMGTVYHGSDKLITLESLQLTRTSDMLGSSHRGSARVGGVGIYVAKDLWRDGYQKYKEELPAYREGTFGNNSAEKYAIVASFFNNGSKVTAPLYIYRVEISPKANIQSGQNPQITPNEATTYREQGIDGLLDNYGEGVILNKDVITSFTLAYRADSVNGNWADWEKV